MRRLPILLLLPLLLAQGCPQPAPPAPPVGPTDVTDALRAACAGDSDAEIRSFLIAAHQARLSGESQTAVQQASMSGCVSTSCLSCVTTLVDHVYTH